jgi:hypothetical protein
MCLVDERVFAHVCELLLSLQRTHQPLDFDLGPRTPSEASPSHIDALYTPLIV